MNSIEVKRGKMLCIDLVLAIVLLVLDQFTKYLAIAKLKDQPSHVLIDGVLEFQYLENRGSAFGILQNQKYFILFVGMIFLTAIFWILLKLPQQKKYCPMHLVFSFIVAGGIGNMIDRIRFDYVVDFIYFVLIDFPIFNVADCYIVCATIALAIFWLFVYKDEDLEFLNFKKKPCREMK